MTSTIEDYALEQIMNDVFAHQRIKDCGNPDCEGYCMICKLFVCANCGLLEGSLTTHCPGYKVDSTIQDQIYKDGNLDFRFGQWVNKPNPTNQYWNQAKYEKRRKRKNE